MNYVMIKMFGGQKFIIYVDININGVQAADKKKSQGKVKKMTNENNHRMIEIPKSICACCGMIEVTFYGICSVCGWQDDLVQNKNPDYRGGANQMSLNEAKEAYKKGEKIY